jgi:hypothetical protein
LSDEQDAVFSKLCAHLGIDPFDEFKKAADIWACRRTIRPSADTPGISSSFLFSEFDVPSPELLPSVSHLLPEDDPRRKISRVFNKAFNTMGDRDAFKRLLMKYAEPTCRWENRHIGKIHPIGPKRVEMNGIDAAAQYFDTVIGLLPDVVFHLQGSDILLKPDGSAVIVVQTYMYGTKLFRAQTDECEHIIVDSSGHAMGIPRSAAQTAVASVTDNSLVNEDFATIFDNANPEEIQNGNSLISDAEYMRNFDGALDDSQLVEDVYNEDEENEKDNIDDELSEEDKHHSETKEEDDAFMINEVATRLQRINIEERVLMPGTMSSQITSLNLTFVFTRPFRSTSTAAVHGNNDSANQSDSYSGKMYRSVLVHTAAIDIHLLKA